MGSISRSRMEPRLPAAIRSARLSERLRRSAGCASSFATSQVSNRHSLPHRARRRHGRCSALRPHCFSARKQMHRNLIPPRSSPRQAHLARPQKNYYAAAPQIERGWREHLFDVEGRAYLDMVNNVAILGHGHPSSRQQSTPNGCGSTRIRASTMPRSRNFPNASPPCRRTGSTRSSGQQRLGGERSGASAGASP